jgi:aminoglycoside 6-adenylyltransferase
MTKPDEFYTIFEDAFISWAEEKDDIRAAFIVGSRARMDHPADEWSDLDIIIYAKDHKTYLSDTDWLENIGNVWITFTYHTASGQPERLILFEGSFQVDMVFLPCKDLYQMVKDRITPDNFYRGVRVLIDKDNISGYIVPSSFRPALSFSIDETVFFANCQYVLVWFNLCGETTAAGRVMAGQNKGKRVEIIIAANDGMARKSDVRQKL